MGEVVAILIVVAIILGNVRRGRKLVSDRPGQPIQTESPERGPVQVPKAAVPTEPSIGQQIQELLHNLEEEISPEDVPVQPEETSVSYAESESFEDESGCIGGSLPHNPASLHEGESALPFAAVSQAVHSEYAAVSQLSPRFSAEELRRAVIAREILGPPKALARRQSAR